MGTARGLARGSRWLALGLVLTCGGCGVDYYARELIHRRASIMDARSAQGPELVRSGRIDLHRRIPAPDGALLDVWVLKAKGAPPRGTVVVLHGLNSPKPFYLPLAQRLAREGWDVVLPDHRAHGASEGQYVTFGALEKHDVRAVVDSLLGEGVVDGRVYAFGVSMGAAIAIQYAALDARCRGVLAVAPYTSLRAVARRYVPLMAEDKYRAVLRRAGEIGRFDPDQADTLAAARRFRGPLVLLHGLADAVVPVEQGRAVFDAAAGPKRSQFVPAAGHVTVLLGREDWFVEQLAWLAGHARAPRQKKMGVRGDIRTAARRYLVAGPVGRGRGGSRAGEISSD